MKVFNNLEEMKPYYNEETNTYEFIENNRLIDVKIDFGLNIECNIKASDINAGNINAWDINAWAISAKNINAQDIDALNISAWDISAKNISAQDIDALDISAWDIKAWNIKACDIKSVNIKANKISFHAVCFAYKTFVCNSIKGERPNSKHFCLDSDVVIKGDKKNVK